MDQVQKSIATLFNRYAEVFMALRDAARARHGDTLGGRDLRILSFGCSTGAEMLTARAYFPDATILGCDISDEALAAAAECLIDDEGEVFRSTPAAIAAFGPFDIILANSVLCLYPLPKKAAGLAEHFPFSKFEELAGMLLQSLAPDGFFVLYNGSYRFRDLGCAEGFQSLLTPHIEANGFVDKFARDGTRLTAATQHPGQRTYTHRVLCDGLADDDFRDCIFHRGAASPLNYQQPNPTGDLILGMNPSELADDEIAAGLFEFDDDGGRRREWRRKTLSGEIVSLGAWDVPGKAARPLSDLFIKKALMPRKKKRWFK